MHDLAFADAARPAGVQILGLRVKPYAVGHELTLLNERNPLVLVNPGFDDLPLPQKAVCVTRAVYVCCSMWNELTFVPSSWWQSMRFKVNDWRFYRAWRKLILNPNYQEAGLQWQAYRAAGFDFPPGPDPEAASVVDDRLGHANEPKGRMLGGPWMARLVAYLAAGRIYEALGYPTPFDVPLRLAEHLHLSQLEDLGRGRIENTDEADIKAKLDKLRREAAAEEEISTHA
jgi:hypothetical protein